VQRDYAERYGALERWHWWFRGRQRILETVLRRQLRAGPLATVVSVGCGPREGLGWLRGVVGAHAVVVGVDVERAHVQWANDGIAYLIGRLEAVPLAARSADAVLALDVLEHLDDDAAGLREASRILRPGGLLLVTVPALPSLWGGQDVVSHHRRRYTGRTLVGAYTRAGLPRPWLSYFNTFLFPSVAAVRWTRRMLGLAERPRTDFDDNRPGALNAALEAVFATERHLVSRVRLPIGVSLLAISRVPA
jgi:SAM-dependent methyltransferase